MNAAFFLACGVAIVIATFSDVFQSVIVPRPARRSLRASAYLSRWGWKAWRWMGHAAIRNETREDFLGTFAPFLLVTLIVFWVASLVFGYGCIFFALRTALKPHPILEALFILPGHRS